MKTIHAHTKLLLICFCAYLAKNVTATTLSVPYYDQVCPEWCWDASAEMVLAYYGVTEGATYADGQKIIATYASGSLCDPNYLYGSAPGNNSKPVVYYWATNTCNSVKSYVTNIPTPPLYGDDFVLKHFGNINSTPHGALSKTDLQNEINAGRPVLIAISWTGGGGHVVVLIGFDGSVVDINDPWPCDGVLHLPYNTLLSGGAGAYIAGSPGNTWVASLTTGASLDLVLLIDSTGSMTPEIDSVKNAAQSIIMNTFSNFTAARVAVIDYRDNPDWTGNYGVDYIYNVDTPFTTNVNTAISAVNPIYANGGGDTPEAVYSAMYDTLQGGIIGGWNPSPTPHLVVVMSDAGGHDPVEPWVGGHSMADVISLANSNQIVIDAVTCGVNGGTFDSNSVADLGGMSGGTGGSLIEAGSAGFIDVAGAIGQAVNQAVDGNYPVGAVASLQPMFTFTLTGVGMTKSPSSYKIQILQSNALKGTWTTYLSATLKTNHYTPTKPMPAGTYQWHVGFEQPATTIESPDATVLAKTPAEFVYPNSYTEFEREPILPGTADLVTPGSYFYASTSAITYEFDAGLNATSYYIVIRDNTTGKVFKKLTVQPPKNNPHASPLSVKLTGHKVGHDYSWTIESLNFDHPKP